MMTEAGARFYERLKPARRSSWSYSAVHSSGYYSKEALTQACIALILNTTTGKFCPSGAASMQASPLPSRPLQVIDFFLWCGSFTRPCIANPILLCA
jgi:hypothetical protein